MPIRIVTDSSADLPPELARRWDITVVPCNVVLNDVSYKDGVELSPGEFYRRLESSPRPPTTSQPSVADFQAVYQSLLAQDNQIMSIHVSGKLSGTVNAAERARESLGPQSASVVVVDSRQASLPQGLVALSAAQAAASHQGPPAQLADQVRASLPKARCYFLLDTLEYLQKGGRIGKAQAFVGNLLSVKPILTIQDGEVHPVERQRNRQRAVARLVELAKGLGPLSKLGVIYSTEPEQAAALRHSLAGLLPEDEIILSQFGAALGTYIGPRGLGVALIQG
ncbi:MAG: DegV family protein [Dehalococcoidia bacterium]|nr:DegV family protein [Dehalococcoidia bacterium]MSQ17219.1 DegV family protein [Dehalococcoidia bacterium]